MKIPKTSKKLEKIIQQAQDYMYGGKRGFNTNKLNTLKWMKLRIRFENEASKIGGVNYEIGDCIA